MYGCGNTWKALSKSIAFKNLTSKLLASANCQPYYQIPKNLFRFQAYIPKSKNFYLTSDISSRYLVKDYASNWYSNERYLRQQMNCIPNSITNQMASNYKPVNFVSRPEDGSQLPNFSGYCKHQNRSNINLATSVRKAPLIYKKIYPNAFKRISPEFFQLLQSHQNYAINKSVLHALPKNTLTRCKSKTDNSNQCPCTSTSKNNLRENYKKCPKTRMCTCEEMYKQSDRIHGSNVKQKLCSWFQNNKEDTNENNCPCNNVKYNKALKTDCHTNSDMRFKGGNEKSKRQSDKEPENSMFTTVHGFRQFEDFEEKPSKNKNKKQPDNIGTTVHGFRNFKDSDKLPTKNNYISSQELSTMNINYNEKFIQPKSTIPPISSTSSNMRYHNKNRCMYCRLDALKSLKANNPCENVKSAHKQIRRRKRTRTNTQPSTHTNTQTNQAYCNQSTCQSTGSHHWHSQPLDLNKKSSCKKCETQEKSEKKKEKPLKNEVSSNLIHGYIYYGDVHKPENSKTAQSEPPNNNGAATKTKIANVSCNKPKVKKKQQQCYIIYNN